MLLKRAETHSFIMAAATLRILMGVTVALCLPIVHSQYAVDQELKKPGTSGQRIVHKVCSLVESALGTTHQLLERTAWVESKNGKDRRTYRPGYHGGIWQVDGIGFLDTQDVGSHPRLVSAHKRIKDQFGIDWTKVKYSDLRKPLYSGIAARLVYRNKRPPIPTDLSGQGKYYKKHYNSGLGKGSASKFVTDVMFHDKTVSLTDVAGCGDVTRGKKIFVQKAAQAHTIDKGGKHKMGPNLSGVCGRRAGSSPGFLYSNAMKNSGIVWDTATLSRFLKNPKRLVPGTKMVFAGIKKSKDLADVIAYICSQE